MSSESEGEIIESREHHKAITGPYNSTKNSRIDRKSHSATPSHSLSRSRSPSPYRTTHPRGYSNTGRRGDRSPSPFRHSRGGADNKRKRHADKPIYDAREARERRGHEPGRLSYHDLDEPANHSTSRYSNGHDHSRSAYSSRYDIPSRDRDRDRSRSPWRPGKEPARHDRKRSRDDNAPFSNKEPISQPHSRESSAKPPSLVKALTTNPAPTGEPLPKRVKFDAAVKPPAPVEPEPQAEPEPLDEEAEIERRRQERLKKREALLNKTRPSELLTQALNLPSTPADMTSVPATPPMDTPTRESRVVTPTTSAPSTPRLDADPNSPMQAEELAKELGGLGDDDAEEESAAMYDPNMDIAEDRAKHEAERNRNGDVSASAYDEIQESERKDLLIPDMQPAAEAATKSGGGDMFADDSDDDDMFAVTKPIAAPTTAVPVPAQGKALAADLHDNWDTPDGFYKTIVGELIDDRYIVKSALGKGVFATVIRAQDSESNKLVAIKIVRNNEAMRKSGIKEIAILEKLAQADPEDQYHVVRLHRHFVHKNHLCMVFENLNVNLRDLVKSYGRKTGLELQVVKSYAVQMFKALVLLRKCEILHADLKPDNILNDNTSGGKKIKIADLGSATSASDNDITPYLASRFYRAPEVMLGIPPSFAIDMWAIGCTLFELYTDTILFPGKSNNEMLRLQQECRGKLSKKVIRRGTDALKYQHFDANMEAFASVERAGIPPKDVIVWKNFGSQPIAGKDLRSRVLRAAGKKGVKGQAELKELGDFVEVLEGCLRLDPEERWGPRQALASKFCGGSGKVGGGFKKK